MIGSNLLDNLDDKNINTTPGSNDVTPVIPINSSEGTTDVNSEVNTVPEAPSDLNSNSVDATISATPSDMSSNVTTENFTETPVTMSSSVNNSPMTATGGINATNPKIPGSKNTYTKTPYDSYVSSAVNKKMMEEAPIIKEGYSLPFNMDTAKLKSFALNFIVPIVGFSVSLILILTVVIPSFTTIPDLRAELNQKQTLNSTLSKKLSDLERLLDFKKIVDDNSNLINNVLVSEEMVPELLSQVDTIAKESGLEVTRLSYSISQASGGSLGYPSVDVSLGVLGTYDQLANFFKLTESASRLIDVSGYRYAVGSKDANTLNMNLVLRSPYLFVNSEAVTDDPIDLDVTNQAFLNFVSKIHNLKYYNPNELPVIENIQETQPEEDLNQEASIPSAQ
jgi:Tfp pilus assembly protein PilO